MKNEIVTIYRWDPSSNEECITLIELDYVIKNPGGFKMDQLGLILFNRERRKLGLSEYKLNPETGTYDEA